LDSLGGLNSDADDDNTRSGTQWKENEEPYWAGRGVIFKKYLAILRANRQIYAEASSLLYTEGTLVIDPMDILCLSPNWGDLDFGAAPEISTWKYNPLESTWKEDKGKVT
jgi:hypothetical protein